MSSSSLISKIVENRGHDGAGEPAQTCSDGLRHKNSYSSISDTVLDRILLRIFFNHFIPSPELTKYWSVPRAHKCATEQHGRRDARNGQKLWHKCEMTCRLYRKRLMTLRGDRTTNKKLDHRKLGLADVSQLVQAFDASISFKIQGPFFEFQYPSCTCNLRIS